MYNVVHKHNAEHSKPCVVYHPMGELNPLGGVVIVSHQ